MAILDELLWTHGNICEPADHEWQPIDFRGSRTWHTVESLAYVLSEFEQITAVAVQLEAVRPLSANTTQNP
jgi:hypothetical protein